MTNVVVWRFLPDGALMPASMILMSPDFPDSVAILDMTRYSLTA